MQENHPFLYCSQMSRPDEDGINLAPNTQTSLSIQVREIYFWKVYKYLLKVNEMHRMEAPYKSNCMKSWDISGYNMSVNYAFSVFNETLRVLYIPTSFSFQLCKSNCHKQAIITNCNCSWPELFIPNSGRYFYFAHIFSFYTFRAWWSPSLRHCAAK